MLAIWNKAQAFSKAECSLGVDLPSNCTDEDKCVFITTDSHHRLSQLCYFWLVRMLEQIEQCFDSTIEPVFTFLGGICLCMMRI